MNKKTIVVHSGGMDSSLCLALAVKEFGADQVLAMSFTYGQRHSKELDRAKQICEQWKVDRVVIDLNCLQEVTDSALMSSHEKIQMDTDGPPNTIVIGRNGLMARVAAIHAHHLGANSIYLGVIEVEEANSGYRDCSRNYMNLVQETLRLDFANPAFEIRTPIVSMTKKETMDMAMELGVLSYLLETTLSCYEGIDKEGCQKCPACLLRNQGIREFLMENPDFELSYREKLKK